MLSGAFLGTAFTHRNDTFGTETLLRGVARVDDIPSMLVHYIHC